LLITHSMRFALASAVLVLSCGASAGGTATNTESHDGGATSNGGATSSGGATSNGGAVSAMGAGGAAAGGRDVDAGDADRANHGGAGGSMGKAPLSPLIMCAPNQATDTTAADPTVMASVTGSNGTFDDACTPGGDRIQYDCETKTTCMGSPNPACATSTTGLARPRLAACGGQCKDGACASACPQPDQELLYTSTDGAGLFGVRNMTDGGVYTCTIAFDNAEDGFDCIGDQKVNTVARVIGGANGTCENAFPVSVVVGGPEAGTNQCTLECVRGSHTALAPATPPSSPKIQCPPANQTANLAMQGSPDIPHGYVGTNGEFSDRCTEDGNLVDYDCEVLEHGMGPPFFFYTGAVAATYVDCGGSCVNGGCNAGCPETGYAFRVQSDAKNGYLVIQVRAGGPRYGCAVSHDDPNDQFDCASGLTTGTSGTIGQTSNPASACTADLPDLPLVIDAVMPSCPACAECTLSCRAVP